MPHLKTRLIAGALTLVLAVAGSACGDDDDGPGTTSPGDTTTTAPIGS